MEQAANEAHHYIAAGKAQQESDPRPGREDQGEIQDINDVLAKCKVLLLAQQAAALAANSWAPPTPQIAAVSAHYAAAAVPATPPSFQALEQDSELSSARKLRDVATESILTVKEVGVECPESEMILASAVKKIKQLTPPKTQLVDRLPADSTPRAPAAAGETA